MNFYPCILIAAIISGLFCFSCSGKKETRNTPTVRPFTGKTVAANDRKQESTEFDAIGEPGKLQSVDVISGKLVNKNVFGDYNGQRVYFCCEESKKNFGEHQKAYLEAIDKKGILLEIVQ